MSFRIVTAADETTPTTLDILKEELADKIDGISDAMLQRMLKRVTSEICSFLNIPAADDGSRRMGSEVIEETLWNSPWLRPTSNKIVLSRRPVTNIASVIVGGTTVDDSGWLLDPVTGILSRIWSPTSIGFSLVPTARTLITYTAGWTLPGDDPDDYTMPAEIEGAAISLIDLAISRKSRDPAVKMQWVTDIERLEFWVGAIGENGSIPPEIAAKISHLGYEPAFG